MQSLNNVYIASTATFTAPIYLNQEVCEIFYPRDKVSRKVYKMAMLLAQKVGIDNRSMVIELTIFPQKKLLSNDHTPKNWGLTFLDKISYFMDLSEIGFISVAYNATSHQEILPNLACKIAMDAGLALDKMPDENN